ncbi:hypothetical protein ACFQ15_05780 [Sphingomonas hankookensis]|uniref:hypothetical protein n=1 Tax=Sphingomonas hankookensis TaxID=563996 RepID=UPI001F5A7105|nr:hypothetical protein [Sphingomonas hankookensis]
MAQRGGILQSRMLGTARPESTRTGPDPTFLDGIGAAFRTTRDESDYVEDVRLSEGYRPIEETLYQLGVPRSALYVPIDDEFRRGQIDTINLRAVWREMEAQRQRNPRLFAGLPKTEDEFRKGLLRRGGERTADQQTLGRMSGAKGVAAGLIGGVAAYPTDPLNLTLMTIGGGGKTIAQTVLRETALNAGLEAVLSPQLVGARYAMGESTGLGEVATNIAIGGIAGGALGGAGKALELRGGDAISRVQEGVLGRVLPALPAPIRERIARRTTLDDADLPDVVEAAIGRDSLSQEEAAAIGALRRDTDIEQTNPFVANGAGTAMHRRRLGDAVATILADVPAAAPPMSLPRAASRRALSDSTAIGSGTVPMGREAVKARIGRAESPSDTARNPLSSATGRYQFTRGTFLNYHKQVFGGDMSDAARWAQATDGNVQERLMDAMLADNAAFLKRVGEAESAGNLYVVHFVGQGGAKKLFAADPSTPIARVLGEDVVRANPFLRGKTAGDTIAWAHQRMGGPAPARAGARAELAGGIAASEVDVRARLQSEIDALQAGAVARAAEPPALRDVSDLLEPAPAPVRAIEPIDVAPVERVADPVDVAPVTRGGDVAQAAPIIDSAGDAPVRIDALVDAEPIVRAVKPRTLPVRRRPSDIVEFIADRGGLRDDEGHSLAAMRGMGKKLVPRAGPLIRKKGMGIDAAGELLWEAGYFRERPTETEVLDMLERAVNGGEKIYALPDADVMAARALTDEQEMQFEAAVSRLPDDFPLDPVKDREAVMDVLSEIEDSGADAFDALARVVEQRVNNWRQRAFEEGDYVEYRPTEPDLDAPDGRFGDAGEGVDGSAPVGRAAERSGGPAAYGPLSGDEAAELIEAQVRAFGDPEGEAPRAQVESVEHDLRMAAAVDPAIVERQRQEAALKAASPMQSNVDQESTIGLGLFVASDQTKLKFEDGSERSLGEMFEDLDGEGGDIDLLRSCLPPAKAGSDDA